MDILGKNVSYQFAPTYRLIRGRADDATVLAECRAGLARTLVRGGGLPGLRARATLVVGIGTCGSVGSVISASGRMIPEDQGGRHAHMAHRAVQRLLAEGHRPTTLVEAEHLIARYAAHELMEHRLFSCLRLEAPEFGMTPDEFSMYARRLHDQMEPAIERFARQLVEDPSGGTIRTPASPRRERRSTRDILEQEV